MIQAKSEYSQARFTLLDTNDETKITSAIVRI